jgi:hypothetical protein
MEVSFVDEHFSPASMKPWSCSQSACSDVDFKGVNKTWKPGDTRDVNGGVDV